MTSQLDIVSFDERERLPQTTLEEEELLRTGSYDRRSTKRHRRDIAEALPYACKHHLTMGGCVTHAEGKYSAFVQDVCQAANQKDADLNKLQGILDRYTSPTKQDEAYVNSLTHTSSDVDFNTLRYDCLRYHGDKSHNASRSTQSNQCDTAARKRLALVQRDIFAGCAQLELTPDQWAHASNTSTTSSAPEIQFN